MAYTIINNYLPSSKYSIKSPYSMSPIGITVHNTANDASAINEVKYMISNNSSTSYHVAIDDINVVLAIPFNRNAWHAGDGDGNGNRRTIGIEICYSKSGGARFDNAEKNAAKYIATLLKEYGWTLSNVYRHKDWSGKNCPHRTMANGWERFLNMIQAELNGAPAPAPTPANPTSNDVNVTYAVRIEGGRILPEVKNLNDYAGIENKKITDVAIKVDKGSIKYQVHVLGGKWLPWVTGYNWNDHNNGYAGCKRPIDAIRIYYNTPASIANSTGYQEAIYRVSPIGSGSYYDWQKDDVVNKAKGMDGYAGALGKAMDKFQIYID